MGQSTSCRRSPARLRYTPDGMSRAKQRARTASQRPFCAAEPPSADSEPGADQHEGRRREVESRLDLDLGLGELVAHGGGEFVRLFLGEGPDRQETPTPLDGQSLCEQALFDPRGLGAV